MWRIVFQKKKNPQNLAFSQKKGNVVPKIFPFICYFLHFRKILRQKKTPLLGLYVAPRRSLQFFLNNVQK
jgi:hypothetical protein